MPFETSCAIILAKFIPTKQIWQIDSPETTWKVCSLSSIIAMTYNCFDAFDFVRAIGQCKCVINEEHDLIWPDWLNWWVWQVLLRLKYNFRNTLKSWKSGTCWTMIISKWNYEKQLHIHAHCSSLLSLHPIAVRMNYHSPHKTNEIVLCIWFNIRRIMLWGHMRSCGSPN